MATKANNSNPQPRFAALMRRNASLEDITAWLNSLPGSELPDYPGLVVADLVNFETCNEKRTHLADLDQGAILDVLVVVQLVPAQ